MKVFGIGKIALRILSFIIFTTAFFSCSSNRSIYNSDFPFSNNIAYSSDSSFSAAVPQGWYQIEDNECNCNNILLIREGLLASLNLVPVAMDNVSSGRIERNFLERLAKYSKILKSHNSGSALKIIDEEEFTVDKIPARAYKYINAKGFEQRVLLFSIGNKYFELTGNSATKKKDILNDLFSAQNSIIGKIRLGKTQVR